MGKIDLERLDGLRAARGRATRERATDLQSAAAGFVSRSRGLASQGTRARSRDLTEVADAAAAREGFAAMLKRAR